jgi:hypothetical protein
MKYRKQIKIFSIRGQVLPALGYMSRDLVLFRSKVRLRDIKLSTPWKQTCEVGGGREGGSE